MNRCAWIPRPVRVLRHLPVLASLGVGLLLELASVHTVQAQTCSLVIKPYATFRMCYGTLTDGSVYEFRLPTNPAWNGKLVSMTSDCPTVACLEYYVTGQPVAQWLLHNGYAVAGSSFAAVGWDVQGPMRNELETLDLFAAWPYGGTPTATVAYGVSFAGMLSAGLVQQHPDRFAGALATAGPMAGAVGGWNQGLDFAFAVQQLLGAGSGLEIVHITNPGDPTSGNQGLAVQLLIAAQATPAGKARIALACALNDMPGWYDPLLPEPAADDYPTRQLNQFLWAKGEVGTYFFGSPHAGLEAVAGGNPLWNTGVDYATQLARSVDYAEVVALYQVAGISLEDDVAQLNAAPRIAADPGTIGYMHQNIVFDGDLAGRPVLTIHTTGDGLAPVQHESAYRSAAERAQDPELVGQLFVHRGGHATTSWAETIVGLQDLFERIQTGAWGDLSPATLNAAAEALGPTYNVLGDGTPVSPAFFDYAPAPFLRPYDLTGPRPVSIADVADDQGGQVRIGFRASGADVTGSETLTGYEVYRRADPPMAQFIRSRTTGTAGTRSALAPARVQLDGWDYVGSVPASADTVYSTVVPTLADSNGTGLHLATFLVRAATADPGAYFDSPPDSGYSVDNLAPAAPSPFTAAYADGATHLHWGASPEADLYGYRVYRGGTPDFVPGPGSLIATQPDTGYADPGDPGSCYKLSAVDVNGNESGFALVTPGSTLDAGARLPAAVFLAAPAPNPTRGRTTLDFGLPRDAIVSLRVYDVNGRLVRELTGGRLPAGEHVMAWDLRDASGRPVGSGVFFARLLADGVVVQRRFAVRR